MVEHKPNINTATPQNAQMTWIITEGVAKKTRSKQGQMGGHILPTLHVQSQPRLQAGYATARVGMMTSANNINEIRICKLKGQGNHADNKHSETNDAYLRTQMFHSSKHGTCGVIAFGEGGGLFRIVFQTSCK